ncbi:LysR family transcriptional regulator [Peterkaempfera bronchialis]|uniref:LysR family transcriptional regulator n=1 Tax=Peterkaempfera bronchialis TaxID=2126346 RepID=A0A345T4Y4_9ACTN|nr:LysR substrate-binding domain-containing protein [Peterkaempfera bronchialis]AXI81039.1 LysR family transcriptional regulator [Peterkaempfera bronchialis]
MVRRARHLDPSAELDLRKLRYFLAVAHHLNFSRAAEELLVAQPALSRAVRALEADLGVTLFERDHHKVTLTPPGTALVREADMLLSRAAAARRTVQAAGRTPRTLTIGFRPGIIITDVVQQFTKACPGAAVNAIRIEWDEQEAAVADGRVDIAWIRTPIAHGDLLITPLFDDPEVVALPAAHPLTAYDSVSLADLANQPMLRYDAAPEHEIGRPSGKRGIRTMEEKLEAVALGHGLALVPETAAAYYQRPDIAYRPVPGASPYQVALATTSDTAKRPEAQIFISTAVAVNARNAAQRGGAAR